ncbi:MAG TPA: class I SAM-dependent methyltransferase [Candidatus Acidoferrales bacterium]|nr:class I SAM-dependent methyltransferase [Candidatus Acidoferrales bacterium]
MAPARTSPLMLLLRRWHSALVHQRRVRVLAEMLAERIPPGSTVLDIGCGDGTIGQLISQCKPGLAMQGAEVAPRPGCKIPCEAFDGATLPFPGDSFDVCLLVDVLHHTTDVAALLREAARVSRRFVLLKDHASENSFDAATLGLMDWVGNRPHGVGLTYNYQSRSQWKQHFAACHLREVSCTFEIPLYPAPFSWIAGRKLHFISALEKISRPV